MRSALRTRESHDPSLALVLTGGGARAAYQVGFLRHLAAHYPDLAPGILSGVSAGGMIAMHLASRQGRFDESVARLTHIWQNLRFGDICGVDSVDLASSVTRWGLRVICGRLGASAQRRSVVDTEPLRQLLTRTLDASPDGALDRITRNLQAGLVRSVALTASSYMTGQSVTWVQSLNRFGALAGDDSRSEALGESLRVDHVMASGALPFIFPAIQIDGAWYGDGGMRLNAPLSPAIRLGARKIIAVSTRHACSELDMRGAAVTGHPRPAQVAGALLNAIFLDLLDTDARRVQHLNSLIDRVAPSRRGRVQPVDVLVLRPSRDLDELANDFEADLPRGARFLLRRLGVGEARSNDALSLLMFQRDYVSRLIDLGEADAGMRASEIAAFLEPGVQPEREPDRPGPIPNRADATSASLARNQYNTLHDTAAIAMAAFAS